MAGSSDYSLIGLPLVSAIFAVLLQANGGVVLIFASISSLAIAIGATAAIQTIGGIQVFGTGGDIDNFSLKLTFVTTFLTVFYGTNIILGLNLLVALPWGIGLILTGILTTMYVFGMFGLASASGDG